MKHLLAALLLCACSATAPATPIVPPVVTLDASAGPCPHLVTDLGCGFSVDACTAGIAALQARSDTPLDIACLQAATSKSAAAHCAGGTCP